MGYKIAYEFTKEASKDAKEKIPIYFLRYVMQHGINLEEENGSDIGYSEYKIWRFPCRVEVKLLKYGGLHPMSLKHPGFKKKGHVHSILSEIN